MSSAKEILERYHSKVTFPITPGKIKAAGYDVEQFLNGLIADIRRADDSQAPLIQRYLRELGRIKRRYKKT